MRKVYLESLGCAKNQVDSEVMLKLLSDKGYERVKEAGEADLIVINTCAFIESAREESVSTFFQLKKANPHAKVIVSGCMAERYGNELFEDLDEADAVFGNRDLKEIGKVADEVMSGGRVELFPAYPDPESDAWKRKELLGFKGSAYLKISEGCGHWCAYCAIPLIRGPLRSRPLAQIVAEAQELAQNGTREINLVAQDLAAYGTDWDGQSHFKDLMESLVNVEGDFHYRMLYIHPDFYPDWLPSFVKAHRDKVFPYFDIPMQHASPAILEKMGRKGNPETYLALVRKIREVLPDSVIRTTMMVGFPGETAADQKIARQFLADAEFDWMGVFCYSREEGTKAATMESEEAHTRYKSRSSRYKNELEKIQVPLSEKRLQRFIGSGQDVLIEERIQGEDLAIGRIYAQAPDVDGLTVVSGRNLESGMVVSCGIKGVNGFDLDAIALEK